MEDELQDGHNDTGPDGVVVANDDHERERSYDDSEDDGWGDDEGDETRSFANSHIDLSCKNLLLLWKVESIQWYNSIN